VIKCKKPRASKRALRKATPTFARKWGDDHETGSKNVCTEEPPSSKKGASRIQMEIMRRLWQGIP